MTDTTRVSPEMRRDSIGSRKKGWKKILDTLQLNRIILLDTPHSVGDTLIIPEDNQVSIIVFMFMVRK